MRPFLLLLLLPSLASARAIGSGAGFTDIAPPQDINWDVFDGTTHVDLAIIGAPADVGLLADINTDNAAPNGVNWPAWSAMFADGPKSLTSSITFAGVTKPGDVMNVPDHFVLDKLQIQADWMWPFLHTGDSTVPIIGFVSEARVTPEPSSLLMAVIALAVYPYFVIVGARRRRGR